MKKLLLPVLGAAALLAAGFGVWSLAQRHRADAPDTLSASTDVPLFEPSASGAGTLLELKPRADMPLRSVHFLRPLPDGYALAQVLTQSDRQMVALFHNGQLAQLLSIPRPAGVGEGFFRLAALADAALVPDDALLLLYRGNGSEAPLVLAFDLKSQSLRWAQQAAGEHLSLPLEPRPRVVYLWGASSAVWRLPLELGKRESLGPKPQRPGLEPVALAQDVKAVSDFLPTGDDGFLIAHAGGLAAWQGAEGWSYQALPAPPPLSFPGFAGVLAQTGSTRWWQPWPGQLLQVKADGSPLRAEELSGLVTAQDKGRDTQLLRLLGGDGSGALLFALTSPDLSAPAAPPATAPVSSAAAPVSSAAAAPDPGAERLLWDDYVKQGLDRLYRWKPSDKAAEAVDLGARWPALHAPDGVSAPAPADFRPGSGAYLLGSEQHRWWLPLDAVFGR